MRFCLSKLLACAAGTVIRTRVKKTLYTFSLDAGSWCIGLGILLFGSAFVGSIKAFYFLYNTLLISYWKIDFLD